MADYGTGEFLAYDGLIDEVRIYNRALSASEIKALAAATSAGVDIPVRPNSRDSKATATNPAAANEPDWISPQVPKPGADGLIRLFDGKHLYGCAPSVADVESGKVTLQNGSLMLNSVLIRFNLIGRDVRDSRARRR